jgi:hypothetical protein
MSSEQPTAVVPRSDGWADDGPREAQAHPGIHGSWHRYDVIEWFEPSSCEYTADHARPICPVGDLASADDGSACRLICERIGVEGGSGAWRCPHHGYFRVFDYPAERNRGTEQATLLADGGREQHTNAAIHESDEYNRLYSSAVVAPNPSTYCGLNSASPVLEVESESDSPPQFILIRLNSKSFTKLTEVLTAETSNGRGTMVSDSCSSAISSGLQAGSHRGVITPKTSFGFSIQKPKLAPPFP